MKKWLFFLVFTSFISTAQNNKEVDSLKTMLNTVLDDSIKVSVLNKIAFNYVFNDKAQAYKYLNQSEKLAQSKKLLYGQNEILNIKGILYDISGNSDSSYFYFNKAHEMSKKYNFKDHEARSLNNLGMYNWNKGAWEKSLDYFFEALKLNDKYTPENKINQSKYYSNIGLIYQELKLFDKALLYHNKAYQIRLNNNLLNEQAISLNNIGICYRVKKEYQKAIETYKKGIEVAKKADNKRELSKITENLGSVYIDLENYNKALTLYQESEKIKKTIEVSPKENLLLFTYISLCYNKLKNYKESYKYCTQALDILKKNKSLNTYCSDLYKVASSTNFGLGNIQEGDEYNTKYYDLLNQLFSEENSKHIADLETKYETEKKEKMILKQKAEARQKDIWLLSISSLFLIGLLLFLNFRAKSKLQKEQLILENKLMIEKSNYKIQEQRLNISRELHDSVGSQLTFIISILDNLKNSSPAKDASIDKKIETLSTFANKSISELRDTIWVLNSKNIDLNELKSRMLNFIKDAGETTDNIQFNFNFEVKNNIQINSKQAINLYRILQETVNNALKHAQAKTIQVFINQENKNLEITISDDGIGFDFDKKKNISFGLNNIQDRIKEINGTFELKSSKENGTSYQFSIKL